MRPLVFKSAGSGTCAHRGGALVRGHDPHPRGLRANGWSARLVPMTKRRSSTGGGSG